ncbi:MAG TPA: histidinol-phosphate transaminase [Steroidobacteraceae bacterium]|nr:histidinol-phosphate transaminase [Steroidobacteraceae bacterium]
MSWVEELARPEIVALAPYQHAAWEPGVERLHANELPWRPADDGSAAGLNRYPEPQPRALVERLAALYAVAPASILAGRGSDEAIDLLTRAFCRTGRDAILICPPTFGMYAVCARIQGAEVLQTPLRAADGFALDEEAVLERCTPGVKLVFLCSPNNPSANLLDEAAILRIARRLSGRALVVVDEAYIEFAGRPSLARLVGELPNLAILRTLSKAYGLAGARCGALIADPQVIALLGKIIPPYAIPQLTLEAVLRSLAPEALAGARAGLAVLLEERERLLAALPGLSRITRVWPSDANFVLAQFDDAGAALARGREAGLLVRDARGYPGLGSALRITIGTPEQNGRLLEAWG